MESPKVPQDEVARLEALVDFSLLDTPPEERFDRLTRLAKNMFGVQIALISLVDVNRQWFKSKQGLEACETGRDISFCGHAILGDAIFHISNALEDPRFADNPLVTSAPNIRFYAGAPLKPDGIHSIGTLCIIDDQPRTLTTEELRSLRDLADCVEREIFQSHQAEQHQALLALTKISSLIDTDYPSLLRQALRVSCAFLKMSNGMINRVQDNDCEVAVQYNENVQCEGTITALDKTLCSVPLRNNSLIMIASVNDSEYAYLVEDALLPIGSYIGLPIRIQESIYGTLVFSDPQARQVSLFSKVEIEFIRLFSEWVNGKCYEWQLSASLLQQQSLSNAISRAQAQFIDEKDKRQGFNNLLNDILALSGSEYGFIGEILKDKDDQLFLKTFAITNIAWDEQTRAFYEEKAPNGMEFTNLNSLFGVAIKTGKLVISNDPKTDKRAAGRPHGHPPLNSFMGIPIHYQNELIAMIGIANRPFGYKESMADFLDPILLTIGQLVHATRVQKQHAESKRRLADIIKGTNIGTWEWNVQSGATIFNERWAEITGYSLAELAPIDINTWARLAHPDDLKRSSKALQDHFDGKLDYYEMASRMRHKNGQWVWVLDRGCLISRTEDGKPLIMSGSHADINEQKEAVEKLAHAHELLEQSNEAARIGSWELDLLEMRPLWSSVTNQIFEVAPDFSCSIDEAMRFYKEGEHRDNIIQLLANAIETGQTFDTELIIISDKGNERWVRVIGLSKVVEGKCERLYGMLQDITERKHIETMKSEFISTVSHELRTPLTSISGALGLIVGGVVGTLPPKMATMLNIAHKNSQRLSFLINDLLDMEKLSAGKMQFSMQKLALAPILTSALETNLAYGIERMISISIDNRYTDILVLVDQQRLLQVLANLLSNAIKYSPNHGNVEIQVTLKEEATPRVRVSVIDQGPGIPLELQSRLFQKFVQADGSDTRKQGGTGLGLAISKELMENMQGKLAFSSPPGCGANFYFELPLH